MNAGPAAVHKAEVTKPCPRCPQGWWFLFNLRFWPIPDLSVLCNWAVPWAALCAAASPPCPEPGLGPAQLHQLLEAETGEFEALLFHLPFLLFVGLFLEATGQGKGGLARIPPTGHLSLELIVSSLERGLDTP